MSAPPRLLTYDEVRAMPDLGERYELIDGVLVVPPSPIPIHARLVSRLMRRIGDNLHPRNRGDFLFTAPLDVRLTDFRALQPDLLYINPDRPPIITASYVDGAPDLVVEVLSPSNRRHDQVTKFGFYAEAGVRECWIVDPERESLTVYALGDGRFNEVPNEAGVARSGVLPGLEIDIPELFADLRQGFAE
jgi:Uma2 family endonuclease